MEGEPLTIEAPELNGELVSRLLYRRDVALARHRAAFARTLGLTDSELLVIVHLAYQGELSPSSIAALLDLSSGGATALVQRLERAGHVTRKPHPEDRRSTLIRLTPTTTERLKQADVLFEEGLERVTARLEARELPVITSFLTQIAELSEELHRSARFDVEQPVAALTRPVPSLWA